MVQEFLNKNMLGDLVHLEFKRVGGAPRNFEESKDVISDLAVHDVDLMLYLLKDNVDFISAVGRRNRFIDNALLSFRSANVSVSIYVNWLTPVKIRTMQVTGLSGLLGACLTNQTVTLTKENPALSSGKKFDEFSFDKYLLSFCTSNQVSLNVLKKEPLEEEVKSFLQAVREKQIMPVTLDEAIRSLSLLEQCIKNFNVVSAI